MSDLDDFTAGEVPPDAQRIANLAYREAKDEGCTCAEPNIAMSPTLGPPYWRAVVEHDPTCRLIARLRAAGAPLDTPIEP